MLHRLSVVLLLGKGLLHIISRLLDTMFTQREGPTQLLLQQKSRMPLAGLVYLYRNVGVIAHTVDL